MPRTARIVAPGYPYHITQRGNYRQNIFDCDEDRFQYLAWLEEYGARYGLSLYAYCLMDNHVHFIAVPQNDDSLARVFSITHMRYSQYLNKKRNASGHLWQGRFYSGVLDEPYLMAALRYVERNPVRAKIVTRARDWKWSSAPVHCGGEKGSIRLASMKDLVEIDSVSWEDYLVGEEDEAQIDAIRTHTIKGRPLGRESFIEKLEKMAGRILTVKPRGRPKKRSIK